MLESDLQRKCLDYLKEKRIYALNIHGGSWSSEGTPDLITCINGQFVAFELKRNERQKLRPSQEIHRDRILKSGGLHYVPYSISMFKEIVDDLIGR